MRISDWSSDVCSSDLEDHRPAGIDVAEGASRHEPAAAPTGGTGAVDPHEPVGSFGGDGHSDQGGESDVGLSSGGRAATRTSSDSPRPTPAPARYVPPYRTHTQGGHATPGRPTT